MYFLRLIAYKWRLPKVLIALMAIELPVTVGCLVLFAIADNDTYRTRLWQNGYDKGFNSPPNEILYDYANYRTPHVPLIWSSHLVQFNIVVSVFSTFLLLAKSTMFIMHCFLPIISVLLHIMLVSLYAVSLHNQSAPDMSDSTHPNPGLAWYLSKGCKYAHPSNHGYCMQARAAYGLTCTMVAIFAVYVIFSAVCLWPTKEETAQRDADRDLDVEMKKIHASYAPGPQMTREEKWEMNRQLFLNLPKTPVTPGFGAKNPMTPRTVAFTQLNGGPTPGTSKGPKGGLKFREQYGDSTVPNAR